MNLSMNIIMAKKTKILISWWALWTDFDQEEGGVNREGPSFQMHQYFYEDYEKHILLCTAKEADTRFEHLCSSLRTSFPSHKLEARYMGIEDVIDFYELKAKVEPILWEHKDEELHLFFSPGTAAMATVWFLLHQQSGLDSVLLQTVKGKDGKAPTLKRLSIERDRQLASFLIKQVSAEQKGKRIGAVQGDYLLTESLKPIYEKAYRLAQANRGNILILGQSGTGKEHLAHYIHQQSPRSKKPFIAVNCAAFGDSLLESRLFGHQKGAFTDAKVAHKGYFEEAEGGSIFLDEIGDISPYMQQLLLRVLQNGEITPIGGKTKKVDVRVIAATNKDLIAACKAGQFRWDLYYRLALVELELPSLEERGTRELRHLLKYFIESKQKLFKHKEPLHLTNAAWEELLAYPFPGNVRELENLIEGFYMQGQKKVDSTDFPKRMQGPLLPRERDVLKLEDMEASHIKYILKLKKYNLSLSARTLGIALNTLKRKMKRYGIER
jgi:transcriptional regulator with PAS, ATPase and Fis domain